MEKVFILIVLTMNPGGPIERQGYGPYDELTCNLLAQDIIELDHAISKPHATIATCSRLLEPPPATLKPLKSLST
jgi:hypothetical protein